MAKKIVSVVSDVLHWIVNRVLSLKQKEFLNRALTGRQKRFFKFLLKKGNISKQIAEVERLKYKLNNLGFTTRAYNDLVDLYSKSGKKAVTQKEVAWTLAVWHANKYTEDDAKKGLEFLETVIELEKDPVRLQGALILKAECLELVDKKEAAKAEIQKALSRGGHPDLYLAYANLLDTETEKVNWINRALTEFNLTEITLEKNNNLLQYDRLRQTNITTQVPKSLKEEILVTIIIPVFNASEVIKTSLESVLRQTWTNIEVLVVDDCSSDDTSAIIEEYVKRDSRVKLIKTTVNGGAYVARNHALAVASGEFVTINDADDWSHPEKIRNQALHLIRNPGIIGNTSQQVRTTNDLRFYRRGQPGRYIFSNMSSFMFRRKQVVESLGYWDSVRFAADSELIRRIKKKFGDKAIVELSTGPLSFPRQSSDSLTGNSAFGYPGYFMGVRKEYLEVLTFYHATNNNLFYDFPLDSRPFPVPEPMWPKREDKIKGKRHFDIIYLSDFRFEKSTLVNLVKEIDKQQQAGQRIGLVQMADYNFNPKKSISPLIRELIDGAKVQMIVYGEKVTSEKLIIRFPQVLEEQQLYIPDIDSQKIYVVVDRDYLLDKSPALLKIDIEQCNKNINYYFNKNATWFPIDVSVRKALSNKRLRVKGNITISEEQWTENIYKKKD